MLTARWVATTIVWSRRLIRNGSDRPSSSGRRDPQNEARAASPAARSGPPALATTAAALRETSRSCASDVSGRNWTRAGSSNARKQSTALAGAEPLAPASVASGHMTRVEPLQMLCAPMATERASTHCCDIAASLPAALPSPLPAHATTRGATRASMCSGHVHRTEQTDWSGGRRPARSRESWKHACSASMRWSSWKSGSTFSRSHFVSARTGGSG
mmetsp:Transcript_104864/g.296638  ORF Transcript_104864/g.296638 Transcript_104864/m.296638 type:complete len:216 (+) Transcript_104864:604-1251(+)